MVRRGELDDRRLAVALHDLAWLLPRTVGERTAVLEPLPTTELEVMRLLVRRPGLSVNDVARELRMRPSNASTAVGALVAQGKLRRRADEADRRVVRLEPTTDALTARDRRESAWGEALTDVLAELLPADVERLLAATPALQALAARLAARG
jgi:DNA-binding MarR family transcriptional regulator